MQTIKERRSPAPWIFRTQGPSAANWWSRNSTNSKGVWAENCGLVVQPDITHQRTGANRCWRHFSKRIGTVVIPVQWRVLHRLKPQSTISIESAERQEKMLPHKTWSGWFQVFSYAFPIAWEVGGHTRGALHFKDGLWGFAFQRCWWMLVEKVHCNQFLEVIICHPNLVKCCLYWNQIPEHILVSLVRLWLKSLVAYTLY